MPGWEIRQQEALITALTQLVTQMKELNKLLAERLPKPEAPKK
jgi:hypothetical protein